eukprot:gnl/TRDRNA2_/TRDRNA2_36085_c0_seq1.p1 gnl/TRDRNA2_/TRDRNA2_36085_c0~~gnl/TRDRNA2_/TRDRNA2_36085_c0_seq1.p1  ORF type:complete len:877 (-),score=175.69 gnl/TRDRNA2_/TRDRNA2_36085_c0_seq1:231-2834(-)
MAATNAVASDASGDHGELVEAIANFLLAGDVGRRLREHVQTSPPAAQAAESASATAGAPAPVSLRRSPLVVGAMQFFDALPEAYPLLQHWSKLMEVLQLAAQCAYAKLVGSHEGASAGADAGLLHVRLAHIPGVEFAKSSVGLLRVSDMGRFVRLVGTTTRVGTVKVVQEWRTFVCEECRGNFTLRASPASGYDFEVPTACISGTKKKGWNSKAKRPKTMTCRSRSFLEVPPDKDRHMNDFQEVRIQDQMQSLRVGVVPHSISAVLFGDLVGRIQPGDTVCVEGVVWQRWRPPWQGKRCELESFVEATNVERLGSDSPVHAARAKLNPMEREQFSCLWDENQEDEWRARAQIIQSTAPWLSGLPVPKLALLLALIGGVHARADGSVAGGGAPAVEKRWERYVESESHGGARQQEGGAGSPGASRTVANAGASASAQQQAAHVRTTPHILLIGDPGTGKSQLLQAAQELGTRSVRTSGLGCTSAGLTCAAIRDGPEWVLEAGALVLADGGVCCIDEFSTIRGHDRSAVHEAMEQQTVSVAKAGFVCRLRSECSVVAAQNCKGANSRGRGAAYDKSESLAVNSGLPPPLLSRFDLVVVFADGGKGVASEQDKADFILGEAATAKVAPAQTATPPRGGSASGDAGVWSHEKVREYIVWAKENCLPEGAEPGAQQVLQTYFAKMRKNASAGLGGPSSGGVTVRTLESLVRLSQAHARLMNHKLVSLEDAIAVVVLHRASLQDHVVSADLGDEFQEQVPLTARGLEDDETPACVVPMGMPGIDLHHGTDIPDRATYSRLEAAVLRSLQLQKDGGGHGCRRLVPAKDPLPLPAVPTPQQQDFVASVPASQQPSQQQDPVPATPRGKTLGCRMR